MTTEIQVAIACGQNSPDYVKFLIESVKKTVKKPDRFQYLLGVNHVSVDIKKLQSLSNIANVTVVDAISGLPNGSKSHAITIDKLVNYVSSDKFMICDADIAFLLHDWDELFLEIMNKHSYSAIGTEYERAEGNQKYLDFPNLICVMLDSHTYKQAKISCLPSDPIVLDEQTAKFMCLQAGEKLVRDTGWELSYKFRKFGHKGYAMKCLTREHDESIFLKYPYKIRGNEFQIDNKPVVTHCGRSSSRDFFTNEIIIEWRKRVDEFLLSKIE